MPFTRDDDYDSDPEVQAEKEMAKKDPIGFAIDSSSLTSMKKAAAAAAKDQVSTTPPNLVIGSNGGAGTIATVPRSKSQDEIAKKQKTAGQSKALKKQRSRGISGCSSRKYSGYDDEMDEDFGDDEDYDHYGGQEVFDEDEEDTFVAKK